MGLPLNPAPSRGNSAPLGAPPADVGLSRARERKDALLVLLMNVPSGEVTHIQCGRCHKWFAPQLVYKVRMESGLKNRYVCEVCHEHMYERGRPKSR